MAIKMYRFLIILLLKDLFGFVSSQEISNQTISKLNDSVKKDGASCYWNNVLTDCVVNCMTGNTENLGMALEEMWNERLLICQEKHMDLSLSSSIFAINQIINSNWFNANIKVSLLKLELSEIKTIESNAFTHASFQTMKHLILNNYPRTTIPSGIFNGLQSLERIEFGRMYLRGFDPGVLDSVAATIKYISLEGSKFNDAIRIDDLFIGQDLPRLETVQIDHDLESLNANSFRSLTAIKRLELSSCQIIEIGPRTFDNINLQVERINLDGNKLTTIPSGLFDRFLSIKKLKVPISGSPWNCDCDLQYFKKLLNLDYKLFEGDKIDCKTPTQYNWRPVADTNFCSDPGPEPDTDPPTSSTRSTPAQYPNTTILPTTTPAIEYIKQECHANFDQTYETDYIELKPKNLKMLVQVLQNKTVLIELERIPTDMVLVWFDSQERLISKSKIIQRTVDTMKCIHPISTEIYIDDLASGNTYTACLIDQHTSQMSPFDCVSFAIPDLSNFMWISLAYKDLCIGMTVLGIILSMIMGAIIGVLVIRRNPAWMRNHKRVVVMQDPIRRQSEIFVMPNGWDRNFDNWKNTNPDRYTQAINQNKCAYFEDTISNEILNKTLGKTPQLPPRQSHSTNVNQKNEIDYYIPYQEFFQS